jgi:hypothetical protein
MKLTSTLLAAVLLNFVSLSLPTTARTADFSEDPAVGTWKLDVEKSKPDPSIAAPKTSIRTYTAISGGLKVRIRTVDADGSEHLVESSFSYDGKLHAVTGTADYDTVAVTRVGRLESHTRLIQDGKVIGQLTRVIAPGGSTMTITIDMTTNRGTVEHDVMVYDRE